MYLICIILIYIKIQDYLIVWFLKNITDSNLNKVTWKYVNFNLVLWSSKRSKTALSAIYYDRYFTKFAYFIPQVIYVYVNCAWVKLCIMSFYSTMWRDMYKSNSYFMSWKRSNECFPCELSIAITPLHFLCVFGLKVDVLQSGPFLEKCENSACKIQRE